MTVYIGFDADNVLQPFNPCWNRYLLHRGLITEEDAKLVDVYDLYERQGFDRDSFVQLCIEGMEDGFIFYDEPPMAEAKEALSRCRSNGWHIRVITDRLFGGRAPQAEKITHAWLSEHNLPYDEVYLTHDKSSVYTDFMVDDLVFNYDALEATNCVPFLRTQPWNMDAGNRRRVADLNEFVDEVERML